MTFLFWLALILMLVPALMWAVAILRNIAHLQNARVQRPTRKPCDRLLVPQHVRNGLETVASAWLNIGFTLQSTWMSRPMVMTRDGRNLDYTDVYCHPDGHIALVTIGAEERVPRIALITCAPSFTYLTTTEAASLLLVLPHTWSHRIAPHPHVQSLWDTHAEHVRRASDVAKGTAIMFARLYSLERAQIDLWNGRTWLTPTASPLRWRLSWRGAAMMTLRGTWALSRRPKDSPARWGLEGKMDLAGARAVASVYMDTLRDGSAVTQWSAVSRFKVAAGSLVILLLIGWIGMGWAALGILLAAGAHTVTLAWAMARTQTIDRRLFIVPGMRGPGPALPHQSAVTTATFAMLGVLAVSLVTGALVLMDQWALVEPPGLEREAVHGMAFGAAMVWALSALPVPPLPMGLAFTQVFLAQRPRARIAYATLAALACTVMALHQRLMFWGLLAIAVMTSLWPVIRRARVQRLTAPVPATTPTESVTSLSAALVATSERAGRNGPISHTALADALTVSNYLTAAPASTPWRGLTMVAAILAALSVHTAIWRLGGQVWLPDVAMATDRLPLGAQRATVDAPDPPGKNAAADAAAHADGIRLHVLLRQAQADPDVSRRRQALSEIVTAARWRDGSERLMAEALEWLDLSSTAPPMAHHAMVQEALGLLGERDTPRAILLRLRTLRWMVTANPVELTAEQAATLTPALVAMLNRSSSVAELAALADPVRDRSERDTRQLAWWALVSERWALAEQLILVNRALTRPSSSTVADRLDRAELAYWHAVLRRNHDEAKREHTALALIRDGVFRAFDRTYRPVAHDIDFWALQRLGKDPDGGQIPGSTAALLARAKQQPQQWKMFCQLHWQERSNTLPVDILRAHQVKDLLKAHCS